MVGAVWLASGSPKPRRRSFASEVKAVNGMLDQRLASVATRRRGSGIFSTPPPAAEGPFESALAAARAGLDSEDAEEANLLGVQARVARRWQGSAEDAVALIRAQ